MTEAAPLGASIRIFLADGGADGVWVVEKSNWTGMALMAPRTRYKDLRPRLAGPGVYLLVGPTESGVPAQKVYIGETDDLPGRLDSHNAKKDFWNRAIVFTSKTTTSTSLTSDTSRVASSGSPVGRSELSSRTATSDRHPLCRNPTEQRPKRS